MGLLADQPDGSPFGLIDLIGLASAELDCLAVLIFGSWDEIGHLSLTVAGTQFADRDRGLLYDAIAGLRVERPRISLTRRLEAIPEHLVAAVSVVLRWSDRPGFEPTADVFCAARNALCHEHMSADISG